MIRPHCRPWLLAIAALCTPAAAMAQAPEAFRPPAVPLVTHDPYFSVWSMNNRLTDDWTKHWTGATQSMCGLIRIDDKRYRFMGPPRLGVPPMTQESLEVHPTRTIYRFAEYGIRLTLTFTTPALPDELDVLSRPITYLTFEVCSTDGEPHEVALYFDCSGELAVDRPEQAVVWGRYRAGDMDVLRIGSKEQNVLAKAGDNLRIDWGYFTLAVPEAPGRATVMTADRLARTRFIEVGGLPDDDDLRMPRPAREDWPVLACVYHLGAVKAEPVSRYLMVGYDDGYAIEHFGNRLRPWWRRNGMEMTELLRAAQHDYLDMRSRCAKFDAELEADLEKAGGLHYARLCALAYRQCIAAHKLVADNDGTPLYFSKENFSNGCIAKARSSCLR